MADKPVSYVLPIRRTSAESPAAELTEYLRWLSSRVDLVVADNSPPAAFAANDRAWGAWCRHVPPYPRFGQPQSPKVANVLTGLRVASRDLVVVADDDVRWDDASLERAAALASCADLVRPQNYFSPRVWHARWDTARSLINRAFSADFPGTLVVRRSVVESVGGYDGDTLFENLELIRTVQGAGGRVVNAPDLFVRRVPPSTSRFWSQRVRQAYDDFALPGRMLLWLSLLPAVVLVTVRFGGAGMAAFVAVSVGVAEVGRRRRGGRQVFSTDAALWAPLWLGERAVCAWLACAARLLFGGVRYNGVVVRRAAHSPRQLRRRVAPPRGGCSIPVGPAS
ncbi:MAG TPA: glycosyltransferase [Acidimicrobiales bacterium]|nr:glycosyltransferase [Acidimicrobiales bacterium]